MILSETTRDEALTLITEFRDFCLTRGDAPIQHLNRLGSGWDNCAVAEFAATKQIPAHSPGNVMACMLRHAFRTIDNTSVFMIELGLVYSAQSKYPTFDKLAADLTTILNQ